MQGVSPFANIDPTKDGAQSPQPYGALASFSMINKPRDPAPPVTTTRLSRQKVALSGHNSSKLTQSRRDAKIHGSSCKDATVQENSRKAAKILFSLRPWRLGVRQGLF